MCQWYQWFFLLKSLQEIAVTSMDLINFVCPLTPPRVITIEDSRYLLYAKSFPSSPNRATDAPYGVAVVGVYAHSLFY